MKWSVRSPLRILLLDDHALIREALKLRLALESDFKVVGTHATSHELLESLRDDQADLLILDYQLADGEIDGFRLIKIIRARYPQLRIIIFSSAQRAATVNLCIRAGANGFVSKTQETEELLKAVRSVASGRIYLAPAMAAELHRLPSAETEDSEQSVGDEPFAGFFDLSPREHEVLRCLVEGLSVTDVAAKFSRSVKTISGQKNTAFRKLGIRTDADFHKIQARLLLF